MCTWVSVLAVGTEWKDKLCVDEAKSTESGSKFHVDSGGGEPNMTDFEPGHLLTNVSWKGENLEKLQLPCYYYLVLSFWLIY